MSEHKYKKGDRVWREATFGKQMATVTKDQGNSDQIRVLIDGSTYRGKPATKGIYWHCSHWRPL